MNYGVLIEEQDKWTKTSDIEAKSSDIEEYIVGISGNILSREKADFGGRERGLGSRERGLGSEKRGLESEKIGPWSGKRSFSGNIPIEDNVIFKFKVLTLIYNIDTLLNVIYFEPFGLKISKSETDKYIKKWDF